MTVGGREWCLRGGSVQLGLGAYVWFVAKTRSSGGNDLFLLAFVDRACWCFSLALGFEKCIACLRLGSFGGFALVGRGR